MPSPLRAPVEYHPPDASPKVPCAVCRTPVDPIRAPGVAHVAGRFRYYCSRTCFDRRGAGVSIGVAGAPVEPHVGAAGDRPSREETAGMLGLAAQQDVEPGFFTQRARSRDGSSGSVRPTEPDPPIVFDGRPAALSVGGALVALSLDLLPGLPDPARAAVAATAAFVALAAAVREAWSLRFRAGGTWGAATLVLGPLLHAALAVRANGLAALSHHLTGTALVAAVVPLVALLVRARLRSAQLEAADLASRLPATARRVRADGGVEIIEATRVRAGEEVRVDTGEAIPVDGIVRGDGGRVRLHACAEEPRSCTDGDSVLAGGRVDEGPVRILATRAGDDVVLSRLLRAWGYGADAPRVIGGASIVIRWAPLAIAAMALVGALVRDQIADLGHLVALALASAPCAMALMLARPPFLAGAVEAARRGIVFRDARSEELASEVGSVVLCLRGTVTHARLELIEIVSLGSWRERDLLALAAGAETIVHDHPIARALTAAAREREVAIESQRRPTYVQGRGILALNPAGEMVAIGSRQLLLEEGISVAPAEEIARAIEGQGRSAIFVAAAGRVEGVLGLQDSVREEVRPAVQGLMDHGFELALLAGESRGTVEAVALSLDIANIRPEVLPDERGAAVRSIADVGGRVAVVGRPRLDGGALGAADVAISLAAAGESGGETAVALAGDDIRDAASALVLARATRTRVNRTLILSLSGSLLAAATTATLPQIGAMGAALAALVVIALAGLSTARRTAIAN